MDKEFRNAIERATQRARTLLTDDFAAQLKGVYDILPSGKFAPEGGQHLSDLQSGLRARIIASIEHKKANGMQPLEAVADYIRDAAFTTLNRFAALKMLEARELVQECISRGEESTGYAEFRGLAPGIALLPDSEGYRLYIDSLFDELSTEAKVLFDRRDPASALWPKRHTFENLLTILNASEIATVWREDETIGWVYQYFNDPAERRKMREESAAPRNSRELAVRNQFFTPRYVVQFLTDNTLGRIWYEMRRGETRLREQCRYMVRRPTEVFLGSGEEAPGAPKDEELSQEESLRQPVYIPYRAVKDPRTIQMLDPACGSMHFGLYAFDLFQTIYEEAWSLEAENWSPSQRGVSGLNTLHDLYGTEDTFRKDVPRLILEHNIHGIDVDPRAVQIASLALWMRAQRAWNEQNVPRSDRPRIRRSNVVCSEPMPGEKDLLTEFLQTHLSSNSEDQLIGQLVYRVFDSMKLAGEVGSLLKIEEDIIGAVTEARDKWLTQPKAEQGALFPEMTRPKQGELSFDVAGITDETFWERAEERIYAALQSYAEQTERGGGYQRRLFADDAARGFAFIDLCRKPYDIILMNPPFGESSRGGAIYIKKAMGELAVDLYSAFVSRWLDVCTGHLGAITSRTGFFLPTFHRWRAKINGGTHQISTCIDLGFGVLDNAAVETAAYTIVRSRTVSDSIFIRLIGIDEKTSVLESLLRDPAANDGRFFLASPRDFERIPLSPFSYWTTNRVRALFGRLRPLCRDGLLAKVGLVTFDDFRFLRLFWEIPPDTQSKGGRWIRFAKGGTYQKWYTDVHLVVNWESDAKEMKALFMMYKDAGRMVPGLGPLRDFPYYFYPGVTWPRSTAKGLNARALPKGVIFGDKGPTVINEDGGIKYLSSILALMNSRTFEKLILLQTASRAWEVGFVQRTPTPEFLGDTVQRLDALAMTACRHVMQSAVFTEPNSLFCMSYFSDRTKSLNVAIGEHDNDLESRERELESIQERLELLLTQAYELSKEDVEALTPAVEERSESLDVAEERIEVQDINAVRLVADLESYCFGATLGRWDIRFSSRDKSAPQLPDPFAPLPVCPPGQLQNEQGLPATKKEIERLKEQGKWNYPIEIPWDGIMVDDPGHPLDVMTRVQQVLEIIWKDQWETVEREACEILDVRTTRDYFRKPTWFFADHLKRYSKSRRQAPIYWPLSTPSGSYTIWLYYHRFSADTLYKSAEFAKEKLRHEEQRLTSFRQEIGPNPAASQRKELTSMEDFVSELRVFHDELANLAPLWKPDLNDGVIINFAPLWRLIALRPWQKDVKSCWDDLVAGKYDWAHLAIHLWPERVVFKCAEDRSIAIAHGLDDIFWFEEKDGKWKPRHTPTQPITEVIKARTSPAVKTALQTLVEASQSPSGRSRGHGSRKSSLNVEGGGVSDAPAS